MLKFKHCIHRKDAASGLFELQVLPSGLEAEPEAIGHSLRPGGRTQRGYFFQVKRKIYFACSAPQATCRVVARRAKPEAGGETIQSTRKLYQIRIRIYISHVKI